MQLARTMQVVGYALCVMAGMLRVMNGGEAAPPGWLVAYAAFGLAFHVGASAPEAATRRRLGALGAMVVAMLAMAAQRPCPYGALTLAVVASQAALSLSPRAAAAWVVAQTAAVGFFLVPSLGWVLGGAEVIALLGFQACAVAAIASARGEAAARAALAHTNEELLEARSLLAEATRARERTRIARDLHDVLGHNLTALALQLEVASHLEGDAVRRQTAAARELASLLLRDVRAVVAATRADHPPALAEAIRAVVAEVPGLAIHLDAPESLVVEESGRADCVVRCVQEIVTNARRHARGAQNLWIRLRREADDLIVEARDDGRAAAAVRDGQGLRGMRSRLEEMGGWLEVRTAPGLSFSLSARLPLRTLLAAEP